MAADLTLVSTGETFELAWKGRAVLSAGLAAVIGGREPAAPKLAAARPKGNRLVMEHVLHAIYHVRQTIDVLADPLRVERRVSIQRKSSGPADRLLSVTLSFEVRMPSDATFSVPMARLEPGTPLERVLERPRVFGTHKAVEGMFDVFVSAPDIVAGTVAADSTEGGFSIAVTPLPRECPVNARLYGHEGRAVVEHEFLCESWLREGETLEVAAQVIHLSPQPWREAARIVGRGLAKRGYAPPKDRPAWAKNAVIYEAEPHFCGGLRGLRAKLPELEQLGFNTVYLMPWHRGSYGTIDYMELDPRLGSFDDLNALTSAAHQSGLHVLFDLLVNIAASGSPYLESHPEWFYRDEQGKPLPHPAWNANCFDPASPGFRRFLADYAARCCDEWGADGFRVDAVAYRGGLWNSRPGLQPHQHAHAVFTLVREIREEIREAHPERILMGECFGPAQVPISDLVCFQWIEWLDWALERVASGQFNGAILQQLLADHFAAMPAATWLTTYTHTHDTLAFAKRDIDGPAVAALFATLTLLSCGTMVFGGGWGMRQRPNADEAREYPALFAFKARLGGVACGEVEFPPSGDPALFIAERPSALGRVRIITNFSSSPRPLAAKGAPAYSRLSSPSGSLQPHDTVVVRL
jgi:hypothetical protein